jgi:hypothetical protein
VNLFARTLTLDDALTLWKDLRPVLRAAEWPRLEFRPEVPETDDADYVPARFYCPRCEQEQEWVTCEDRSGPRWTDLEIEAGRKLVSAGGDYGSSPDCHTFLFLCTACKEPVRLPEGWSEL